MKSFVYLDEYKMYSLSSQLMEGVTDFVVSESSSKGSEEESQQGPFNSGRKMASIIETTSGNVEKKFLHDYAYALFEEKLQESGKINSVTSGNSFSDIASDSQGRRFIRIKAKASFLDAVDVMKSMESLVDIQEAISIISVNDEREALIDELLEISGNNAKRARFSQVKQALESLSKPQVPKEKAANDRLHYKNTSAVLEHGFKRRLDLSMDMRDCRVDADLKRDCLKDPEDFVFKTYSRVTDVELVLLGMVTQCLPYQGEEREEEEEDEEDSGGKLSEMIRHTTAGLQKLEAHFHRAAVNQIIVHPIAVYLEL